MKKFICSNLPHGLNGSIILEFLILVSVLDLFCSGSQLQMLFAYSPLDCMTRLVSVIVVMFYLLFLSIKSYGKFAHISRM